MKEVNGAMIHSIEFDYRTMYSQFYFTYANGLEGCIELMLEGDNDWILILKYDHEPEDIEQLLNEMTDERMTKAFPGWHNTILTYQHKPDIGWVIHSEFSELLLWLPIKEDKHE